MTEKEKAKELVEKFKPHGRFKQLSGGGVGIDDDFDNAKRCALICCDEIINYQNEIEAEKESIEYYKEVKNQINLL